MIWLVVIGLGIWCWLQQQRLSELGKEIFRLRLDMRDQTPFERRSAQMADAEAFAPRAPVTQAEPPPSTQDFEPSSIAEMARSIDLEAVPLPPSPPAAPRIETPALEQPERGRDREDPAFAAPYEPVMAGPLMAPGRSLSDWLSENGLAWIGGGALALGGLMLVAYAAQRGLFTPGFRIFTALVIGFVAIGIGEWLRRKTTAVDEAPQLVASLTTAAGAAILYAAVWAANVLYNFIPLPLTATLLASISLGLLGLALLHGEALGILAVLAAFAVPLVSGGMFWNGGPLDAYLVLIAATGLAATGLRRWRKVGAASLAATAFWTAERLLGQDAAGVSILTATTTVMVLAAVWFEHSNAKDEEAGLITLSNAALIGAAVFNLFLWIGSPNVFPSTDAVLTTLVLTTVAALGIRLRLIAPKMLLVPAAIVILACGFTLATTMDALPVMDAYRGGLLLLAIAAVASAGLYSALRGPARQIVAMIGAATAALGLTLLGPVLAHLIPQYDVAIDIGFAILLSFGALVLARTSPEPSTDLSLAAWVGASAEAVGLALHAGIDGRLAPSAYGLLAIVLAGLAFKVRWRGFAEAAAIACLASFASLLGPGETQAVLTGHGSWLRVAAIAAGAVLTQSIAWRLLRRRGDVPTSAEASSTLAIISALLGAFLVVQCWSTPAGSNLVLGAFEAASLRTLLMLTAGLTLALRGAATPIGRWRAPVILTLGVLHGLLLEGLVLHPWWGISAAIIGPPIADTLLLGLLAPALVLAIAGWRLVRSNKTAGGLAIAAALLFLGLWIVSEVRRLFHGADLGAGLTGYAEYAAYALAFLVVAGGLSAAQVRLARALRSTGGVTTAISAIGLVTLAWSLITFVYLANPWWGPANENLGAPLLLFSLYGLGIMAAAWIARQAVRSGARPLSYAAVTAGLAQGFVLLVLTIRFAFHGVALHEPPLELGLQSIGFAEYAAYGVAWLGFAGGLGLIKDRLGRWLSEPRGVEVAEAGFAWVALLCGLVILAFAASPWWGPLDGDLGSPALLFILYVTGISASGLIARKARLSGQTLLARAALFATALEGFCLLTLVIRYGFHGAAMRAPLREASLETWTFSALWALYGLGLLSAGAARKDLALRVLGLAILLLTTAKVFLFDMATLEGVVRAASFLALGAVLLFGAFTARRFRSRPLEVAPETPTPAP